MKAETNLSTMEAEIIALTNCYQEMFPIINITQSMVKEVDLLVRFPSTKVCFHEDYAGTLILELCNQDDLVSRGYQ